MTFFMVLPGFIAGSPGRNGGLTVTRRNRSQG